MQRRVGWLVAGLCGTGLVVALLAGRDPTGDSGERGSPDRGPEHGEASIKTAAAPVAPAIEEMIGTTAHDEGTVDAGMPPVAARTGSTGAVAVGISGGTARGSQTVEVGEYIDPEDYRVEEDRTVIRVGDYLDPDSDFTGD